MKQLYLGLLAVILILCSACSSGDNTSNSINLSQTYKNESEGFVFKYPNEWQTKEPNTMIEVIKIQSPDGNAKFSVMKILTNPFGILTENQESVEAAVNKMHKFIEDNDYKLDITDNRHHHEIYLGDPRKANPNKLKTVIRLPIK